MSSAWAIYYRYKVRQVEEFPDIQMAQSLLQYGNDAGNLFPIAVFEEPSTLYIPATDVAVEEIEEGKIRARQDLRELWPEVVIESVHSFPAFRD